LNLGALLAGNVRFILRRGSRRCDVLALNIGNARGPIGLRTVGWSLISNATRGRVPFNCRTSAGRGTRSPRYGSRCLCQLPGRVQDDYVIYFHWILLFFSHWGFECTRLLRLLCDIPGFSSTHIHPFHFFFAPAVIGGSLCASSSGIASI